MFRLVVLLSLVLLACAATAVAQTAIHRCIGANGGAVFTDQPCAALQATPVKPADASAGPVPAAGPPPVLCAASVDELRQSVVDAFARRDTVRMAGLILWDGYGRSTAIADIRALADLMKQPLLGVDTSQQPATPASSAGDDFFRPSARPEPPGPANRLVLHTAGDGTGGGASDWHFDIIRRAGCLWLRNTN